MKHFDPYRFGYIQSKKRVHWGGFKYENGKSFIICPILRGDPHRIGWKGSTHYLYTGMIPDNEFGLLLLINLGVLDKSIIRDIKLKGLLNESTSSII
jgi:hypothetical protein